MAMKEVCDVFETARDVRATEITLRIEHEESQPRIWQGKLGVRGRERLIKKIEQGFAKPKKRATTE